MLAKAPLSPVALSLPTPRPCCLGPVSALPPGPATRDPPRTLSHSCQFQPGHPARAGPLWSPLQPQGPSKARLAQPPVPGAQQTLLSAPQCWQPPRASSRTQQLSLGQEVSPARGLLSACSHTPNVTWAVALIRALPNREALPLEGLPLAFCRVIKNLASHLI